MTMATTQIREGDVFVVPLRDGGYGLGVLARYSGDGLAFGYFFGPRMSECPDSINSSQLDAKGSVLVGQFGDPGLIKGQWPVIGHVLDFDRKMWPMPYFSSSSGKSAHVMLSEYDENTLTLVRTLEIPASELEDVFYVPDRVMGYGSVEIRLTKLLAK